MIAKLHELYGQYGGNIVAASKPTRSLTSGERVRDPSHRLLRIVKVHQLHSQRKPASHIAVMLNVSRRTVFRDLAVLKKLYQQLGSQRLDS